MTPREAKKEPTMSNETPAEVLADITIKPTITREEAQACQRWAGMDGATAWHLIDRHADNWADVGLMMDAWLEANRSLAAGKVADPVTEAMKHAQQALYWREKYEMLERDAKNRGLEPAPPADPAKASEPDEVRIDFTGIGYAGPFAVANGEITLPAETMSDLAHHFRMGYVAKASGSAPDGWTEDRLRAEAKARGWYTREGASVPSADEDWRHPFEVTIPSRDLCALLATPPASAPEVTEAMVESLRLTVEACNQPCFTDKAERDISWAAVSWMQSHGPALVAALQQEGKSHES